MNIVFTPLEITLLKSPHHKLQWTWTGETFLEVLRDYIEVHHMERLSRIYNDSD